MKFCALKKQLASLMDYSKRKTAQIIRPGDILFKSPNYTYQISYNVQLRCTHSQMHVRTLAVQ